MKCHFPLRNIDTWRWKFTFLSHFRGWVWHQVQQSCCSSAAWWQWENKALGYFWPVFGVFLTLFHTAATETGICSWAQTNNMISRARFANTHRTFFPIIPWKEGDQLLMRFTGDNNCSCTSAWAVPRGQREGEDTSSLNTISNFYLSPHNALFAPLFSAQGMNRDSIWPPEGITETRFCHLSTFQF